MRKVHYYFLTFLETAASGRLQRAELGITLVPVSIIKVSFS
jgi:hypothetical protein